MKKVFLLVCFLGYSINHLEAQTHDFLEEFRRDYKAMFQNEDFESLTNYYSNQVRLMPEFNGTVLGLDKVKMYYDVFFKAFDIKEINRQTIEVLDLGSKIIEHGSFKLTVSDTGGQYLLEGKYQQIWDLTTQGNYRLILEAWNYDHGVSIGDKLRFYDVPSIRMALEPHVPIDSNISFELAGLNALMELTIMEKDANIWSMFYTDDAISMHSFSPLVSGRIALDNYFEAHAKEMPVFEKLDVRTDRIEELDGYVLEYATAIANWRNGSNSGISTSKNTRLWRREPNGSLKIFRMIAVYD